LRFLAEAGVDETFSVGNDLTEASVVSMGAGKGAAPARLLLFLLCFEGVWALEVVETAGEATMVDWDDAECRPFADWGGCAGVAWVSPLIVG
jgi:hypothetical protein